MTAPTSATLPTILIVDDEPANLAVLKQFLEDSYQVRAVRSGAQALRVMSIDPRPSLVLLDIMMPDMDGYALLGELRKTPAGRDTPVIFVTALADAASEERGLDMGAVDYLSKPVQRAIVLARVRLHLELKDAREALARQNARLEARVRERTEELSKALQQTKASYATVRRTYFRSLKAISEIAGLRSESLGAHSRRVAELSRKIALRMDLHETVVQNVFIAALMHDIGKIGLDDSMIDKPMSEHTTADQELWAEHPAKGAETLREIDEMAEVALAIRHHHERWDGRGFPDKLSGTDIPVGARIICVADAYDGYRRGRMSTHPFTARASVERIRISAEERFDPEIVEHLAVVVSDETDLEVDDRVVLSKELKTGMITSREIMHPNGQMLVPRDTELGPAQIDRLRTIEIQTHQRLQIRVLRPGAQRSRGPRAARAAPPPEADAWDAHMP